MKSYKELGNKYIKHRKKRAVLVTLSMVLAMILIYAVTTVALNYWFDQKAMVEEQYNYHGEIPEITMEQCEKIENYSTVRNGDYFSIDDGQSFQDYYGNGLLYMYFMENTDQTTFNFKLVEGELPKDETEIVLAKDILHLFKDDIEVGSTVKTERYAEAYNEEIPEGLSEELVLERYGEPEIIREEYVYTVVGIYEYENYNDLAYGTTAFSKATSDMTMTAYVRFDTDVDWYKYVETLAKDIGVDIQKPYTYFSNDLMETFYFKGQSVAYVAMFLMLMLFVVYISMVMVRGLFTANLMDNITEFSILKAMGATDKKIKAIFKREIYLEGLVAFTVGAILTHVLFAVLDKVINVYGINFGFTPIAVVFAFGFLYLTIALAIIEPFGILKKVPIVEGIKANYAINTMKDKKRASKLFRIFGIEGEYAYKNIRRNSKSFWNGVATFSVSVLVLTVLATVLANFANEFEKDAGAGNLSDVYDYYTYMITDDKGRVDKAQEAFDKTDFIKSADPYYIYVSTSGVNTDILMPTEEAQEAASKEYSTLYLDSSITTFQFYTEEQLEKLNAYMMDGVDANTIRDGGAIIINSYSYYDPYDEKDITVKLWDIGLGDTVKLDTVDYMVAKNEAMGDTDAMTKLMEQEIPTEEVKVEGFCYRGVGPAVDTIILSYDYYVEKYGKDIGFLCQGFFIDIDEGEFEITDMVTLEKVIYEEAAQLEYEYMNLAKWMDEQTRSMRIIIICVVGFILLMGIVSILNNMVNEMQVRRREVSILRAVGMSKKKLNRMLILERVIMGLIAWVIGTVLGLLFSKMLLVAVLYLFEATLIIPWGMLLLIGVGVVGIMVLISMIMVVSMGKMDITEGIRNQE